MPTARNNVFCGGCGKTIKRGQKVSLEGLCYDCRRKQRKRFKSLNEDIGKLRRR